MSESDNTSDTSEYESDELSDINENCIVCDEKLINVLICSNCQKEKNRR